MTTTKTRWEDNLPSDLRAKGVSLVEASMAETAWPIEHCQQLLKWLGENHYAVLGGDFYERKESAFIPAYTTWHCNLRPGESWAAYGERSCAEALKHVAKAKKKMWVVIVASLKPTAEQLATRNAR
jgi:hypothetical protein